MKERLLLSTRNAHKVREVREILSDFAEVIDLSAIPPMDEVAETGDTFQENAALKATAASLHFDGWVLADDSGLEVDALDGAPGVRSARFAGGGATDADNRELLLEKLADVSETKRTARFRCALVLAKKGHSVFFCDGAVEGRIILQEQGEGGFGYDALFVPNGHEETFAQLSAETKNSMSHRGNALQKLRKWFEEQAAAS